MKYQALQMLNHLTPAT